MSDIKQIVDGAIRNHEARLHKKKPRSLLTKSTVMQKNKHLDFVFLADDEYMKLVKRFGEQQTNKKIDALNDYIGSTGKKYKSHYHTILMWSKKDTPEQQPKICVVCRAEGYKWQPDGKGGKIWLCKVCLAAFEISDRSDFGHLPLGQIERIVLLGKTKQVSH